MYIGRNQIMMGIKAQCRNKRMHDILLKPDNHTNSMVALFLKDISENLIHMRQTLIIFLNLQNDATGMTLLHATIAGENDINITRYLLHLGIDLNIQDFLGNTALHTCVAKFGDEISHRYEFSSQHLSQAELIKSYFQAALKTTAILIASGANPLIKNNKGETPFNYLNRVVKSIGVDAILVRKMNPTMTTLLNIYNEITKDDSNISYASKNIIYENFEQFSRVKILDCGLQNNFLSPFNEAR